MAKSSFSEWANSRQNNSDPQSNDDDESSSFLGKITSLQDNISSQMLQITGTLPDSGPISPGLRARIQYSLFMLIGSALFLMLAIFIGLPTIVVRPSKFVMCMSLSQGLAFGAVVTLQKPSAFLANLLESGPAKAAPVVVLVSSLIFTLYTTIFIHSYILTIACGILQLLCIIWFLASFIPGGTTGVLTLFKTAFTVVSTFLKPLFYLVKKTAISTFNLVFSSS